MAETPQRLSIAHVADPLPLGEGPATYRVLQPCRALGELPNISVVSGTTLSPALFETDVLLSADVLVVGDVADPDLLPIFAARRRERRLTIYEITSHLFATPPGPANADGRRPADLVLRSLAPMLARQADAIQFSTAALEAEFAALGQRRAVFPSQLWDAPPPLSLRRLDRVVIGWGGTRAHREDLRAALPALTGVLERHPEVRVAIMADPSVRDVLDSLPGERVSFSPWDTLEAYYQFLEHIDIGIAPLEPTPYNKSRGDVRFIEYAAHGVLAVCADLEPYREAVRPGQTGYLYQDVGELETVLERALSEGEVRAAIPARAARYVATERLERRHAAARLGFYLEAAAQGGLELQGRATTTFPPAFDDTRDAPRRFPDSSYLALGAGKVEPLLAEGLHHRWAGGLDEARRCFSSAARLAPHSHLPLLLLGSVEPPAEAVASLLRAEALRPSSCHAPYLRGTRLLETGDRTAAAAAFERARGIAPAFAAPQERLGALAEAAGRIDEACRLYEEAALHNGTFALPIARLAAIAQKDGKIDKAVGLLERSLEDDPDLSLTNFLIGRAYVELRRYNQARVHLLRAIEDAEDRAAVLTELAKAEIGLGNVQAARDTLEEARRA
jgi:tetratricopeptide (TPR) repeat protein